MLQAIELMIHGIDIEFKTTLSAVNTVSRIENLLKWKPDGIPIHGQVVSPDVQLKITSAFVRSNGTQFVGQVVECDDGVAVIGKFIASGFVRFSCFLQLSVCALFALGGWVSLLRLLFFSQPSLKEILLYVGGVTVMSCVVLLFARLIIWNGCPDRKHVQLISKAIQDAIT